MIKLRECHQIIPAEVLQNATARKHDDSRFAMEMRGDRIYNWALR